MSWPPSVMQAGKLLKGEAKSLKSHGLRDGQGVVLPWFMQAHKHKQRAYFMCCFSVFCLKIKNPTRVVQGPTNPCAGQVLRFLYWYEVRCCAFCIGTRR